MGVSIARVSQIEHDEVASFEVVARYVEALGGQLELVADFGDRTVRLPVSDTAERRQLHPVLLSAQLTWRPWRLALQLPAPAKHLR
jgi:hypothetical protein